MMLIRTALTLIAGLLMSTMGAMALGGLQPLHPAIQEMMQGCDDLTRCWHGITAGESTLEQAEKLWGGLGYAVRYETDVTLQRQLQANTEQYTACRLYASAPIQETQTVQDVLAFYCREQPRLGDLILAMGAPVVQVPCSRLRASFLRLPGNTQLNLWWGVGYRWTAFIPIDSLLFNVQQEAGTGGRHTWRGFAPAWRYCVDQG